jgi:hypothetical protein
VALEFADRTALKNYFLTNYSEIRAVVKEVINTNEVNDSAVNHVWYQISFLLELPNGGFERRKVDYYVEVTRDGSGNIVSEGKAYAEKDPFVTPTETLVSKINAKLGTVLPGGKTIVGIVIQNVNEQAQTAVIQGYLDDGAGNITEEVRLAYDDAGTLKIVTFT